MIHLLRRTSCLLACLVFVARAAAAQGNPPPIVTINSQYSASAAPPGIAVMPVVGPNGDSVQAIIDNDLVNSDRFDVKPLDGSDPKAFRDSAAAGALNYPFFKALKVRWVIQITPTVGGLHVALHDVDSTRVGAAKDYPIASIALSRDWRFSLHVISDAIEEWITGRRGIAATRIAYIRGGGLRLVDSDGAGDIAIPSDSSPYCPAWSPDGKTIAYNTVGTSKIMTVDLATGHPRTIIPYLVNHTVLGPQFTPSGDSIVFFRTDGNVSDLWSVSEAGAGAHRIVGGLSGNESNPSFSPDGRRLAFTSGRANRPEVYIMDADGTNASMLTSMLRIDSQTWNSDPAWAPDELRIAFQSYINQKFQLVMIKLQDNSTKQLTGDGQNKHPSWAPDSRHLAFESDRSGATQLWVIDVESGTMRQVTHGPSGAHLAAWSPRLQP